MGKESEKEWRYIYITGSLRCTPETNTTLYINYTPIKIFKKKESLMRLHESCQSVLGNQMNFR